MQHFPFRHIFSKLALIVMTASFVACSQEENLGETSPGQVRFHIQLATAGLTPDSRGNDVNANDNEYMANWFVIMTDESGKIEGIYERGSNASPQVERERIATFSGEAGKRNFHCFANLTKADVLALYQTLNAGLTFADGETLPTIENLNTLSYAVSQTGTVPSPLLADWKIPMTGIQTGVDVDNNSTVTLYVYRMLTKLRFTVTNKCNSTLNIKKITMGDITLDDDKPHSKPSEIYFFPPRDALGVIKTRFPDGKHQAGKVTFYENATGDALAKDASKTYEYYISPSVSDIHPSQHFPITIEVDGIPGMNTTRFALTSLDNIRRNSIVNIPITLTGYDMDLEAALYAPIGGYPDVAIVENKGEEYYCKFQGTGEISLRTHLYAYEDHSKPENWFDLFDPSRVDQSSIQLTYEDPEGIFSVTPHFNGNGSEIAASLIGTTKPGTATVKLNFHIKLTGDVVQTYSRIFYIIQQP